MTPRLRFAASLSASIAAVASAAFLLWAFLLRPGAHNNSMLLLALMTTWVVAPFVVVLWAIQVSRRWQEFARKSLYIVTLLVAAGAVVAYTIDALRPPRVKAAAVFVAVPLASWILGGIVVAAVALRRKRPAG
jgi:hypothetical protein